MLIRGVGLIFVGLDFVVDFDLTLSISNLELVLGLMLTYWGLNFVWVLGGSEEKRC
jgi:hypothetical protein